MSVTWRLLVLLLGSLAFWGVTAGAVYFLAEDHRDVVLGFSGTALVLCLVPAVGTMVWACWGLSRSAEHQLAAVLGGSGIRMFFVLGAGLLLTSQVPYFQPRSFWIWLLVFYLFILTLEMVLLAGRQNASQPNVSAK
jgi:hypothetical protein